MVDTLKLPEKTRATLAELYRLSQQAQKDFQQPLLVAMDFLGLDPNGNHQINFDTGIIIPAEVPAKPTLIKPDKEAAS
jgi:hypothetical protein